MVSTRFAVVDLSAPLTSFIPSCFFTGHTPVHECSIASFKMNSGSMPSWRHASSLLTVNSRALSVRGLRIFLRISSNASHVFAEIHSGRANDEGVAFGAVLCFCIAEEDVVEDCRASFMHDFGDACASRCLLSHLDLAPFFRLSLNAVCLSNPSTKPD